MADPDDDDSPFEWKSGDLTTWLEKQPGAHINPRIQLTDLRSRGAGRGVVAAADIASGEELFTISLNDVLGVKTSSLSKTHLGPTLQQLDEWLALTLVLLFEQGQAERSHWSAYLKVLPNTFDTLMHWTPLELKELQGSAVLDKIGKTDAEKAFTDQLLPIIKKNAHMFPQFKASTAAADVDAILMKEAHIMATLIMAYAFDLEEEQEDTTSDDSSNYPALPKGMVPLADMFNANGDQNNAHLIQSHGSLSMVSLKPIMQGEEIFNDYGQLPRSDLLRRYGYVTDHYKLWDVVEIEADLIIRIISEGHTDESNRRSRIKLTHDWGIYQDSFELRRDQISSTFNFERELCLFVDALTMDFGALKEEMDANDVPEAPRFTHQMGSALKEVLHERFKAYKTTIAEDTVLLANDDLPGRLRMAIEVRLGEKEILANALAGLQRQMDDIYDEDGKEKTGEANDIGESIPQETRVKKKKL